MQAKARGSGATLSECNFYEKIAPTQKELRATKKTKETLWLLVPTSKRPGATLTECTFVQKCTSAGEKTKKTISRFHFKKEPGTSLQTTQPLKLNHEMLGGLSMRDP